jgi:hypothetical protein
VKSESSKLDKEKNHVLNLLRYTGRTNFELVRKEKEVYASLLSHLKLQKL